ncbi:MAG: DivIVA domain-containing protein [Desulfuromonadales bacterium]
MSITPIDIQQHQFKTRPLGYEKSGVDHFLELVAEAMERVLRQNQELKENLAHTRAALEDMRARELTLKETLLTTQKVTDELKANARKEAENLLVDAQLRGERIVRDAEERRIQLIGEIQEAKRQKVAFETGLRNLVESHLRLLDLDVVQVGRGEERLLEQPLPFDRKDGDRHGEK